jgi:hypothetical protein
MKSADAAVRRPSLEKFLCLTESEEFLMIIRSNRVVTETPVVETAAYDPGYTVGDRIASLIYTLASITGLIILVRFVLLIAGANQNNEFVTWMMKISQPLVQPFLSLFGYSPSVGQGVVEWTDLVAIAVYWIAAAIVARLVQAVVGPRYSTVYP